MPNVKLHSSMRHANFKYPQTTERFRLFLEGLAEILDIGGMLYSLREITASHPATKRRIRGNKKIYTFELRTIDADKTAIINDVAVLKQDRIEVIRKLRREFPQIEDGCSIEYRPKRLSTTRG